MTNTLHLPVPPREADMQLLVEVLPECVAATIDEVGVQGLKDFFGGYRDSIDTLRQAA